MLLLAFSLGFDVPLALVGASARLLYQYSLSQEAYVGFYPAHRGSMSQPYVLQRVQSPDGVVPLYHPIAVALTPSGKVVVQEHVTGRVSILSKLYQIHLPLVLSSIEGLVEGGR